MKYIIWVILLFVTIDVFARAWWWGWGWSWSWSCDAWFIVCTIMYIVAIIITAVNAFLIGILLPKKHFEAKKKLKELSYESNWSLFHINKRVEECFSKVQYAWEQRNQDLATQYISEKIYKKHKKMTDRLIKKWQINKLDWMRLHSMKIVEVKDFYGKWKDNFTVFIKWSSKDYYVDDKTGKVVSWDKKTIAFEELWTFIYDDSKWWVLNNIDNQVLFTDLLVLRSKKQETKFLLFFALEKLFHIISADINFKK